MWGPRHAEKNKQKQVCFAARPFPIGEVVRRLAACFFADTFYHMRRKDCVCMKGCAILPAAAFGLSVCEKYGIIFNTCNFVLIRKLGSENEQTGNADFGHKALSPGERNLYELCGWHLAA